MTAGLFTAPAAERGLAPERQVRAWSAAGHELGALRDLITVLRAGSLERG